MNGEGELEIWAEGQIFGVSAGKSFGTQTMWQIFRQILANFDAVNVAGSWKI